MKEYSFVFLGLFIIVEEMKPFSRIFTDELNWSELII